jgi:hypothetical protein
MDERARRIGENEAIFREVNERVRKTSETFAVDTGEAQFICECGRATCMERITLTLAEYEDVRSDPTTFAIVPGHEEPDVEYVIAENDRFAVVRKRAGDPAALAADRDPRG